MNKTKMKLQVGTNLSVSRCRRRGADQVIDGDLKWRLLVNRVDLPLLLWETNASAPTAATSKG